LLVAYRYFVVLLWVDPNYTQRKSKTKCVRNMEGASRDRRAGPSEQRAWNTPTPLRVRETRPKLLA